MSVAQRLARVVAAMGLVGVVGCAGALPIVSQVVIDAGCVAGHFDELVAAEQAGLGPFALAVERVARQCGIEQQIVVEIFGTHKQARAAKASAACSASVRP